MKLQALLLLAFGLSASVTAYPGDPIPTLDIQHHHRPTKTKTRTRTTTKHPHPTGRPCAGNTPQTRSQWCQFDVNTDYTQIVPNTGVTREYWLNLEDIMLAPDGFLRPVMAVNGTIPGPTIIADWGDWVVIHVTNSLHQSMNGTSIHWHGIRQNYTNGQDGVVSITQCPTAPGSTITYKWRAVQYGSSWYHSHIGLQSWEGVFGGILINGPATANYDVDKGSLFLMDWSHPTVDQLFLEAQLIGPPTLDTGLINGTNVFGNGTNSTGQRFEMQVNEGTSYRLRLVNPAVDTHWKFSIDNHTLTVIGMDFVPIRPFTTDHVNIGMGQRYDVIVTAIQRQIADSFWIRAIPQEACSENANPDNIRGILYYGDSPTEPTTTPFPFTDECVDEPVASLVPQVPKVVSAADWNNLTDVTLGRNEENLFRWFLNSTTMQVFWENPTLLQLFNSETTPNFTRSSGVIELQRPNEWAYLMINTSLPVAHPIHLHGHDFFILAQGSNPWDGSVATNNPPRRDTAMLVGNGFLFIAFETDNPGAWLMHCHIGWHVSEGFALQFLERESEIEPLIDRTALEDNCASWNVYDETFDIDQDDSGV
ncbi:Multicopper oxidase, type 3 [Penicillium griseofulvum]|uniref:Multicopper oxidase, type 3 n=1 Tax=Penicillium patulum TaxID=5078 RepID=A0A135LPX3_PENPA|nr:Multicopper oxidase, type 3 [Penicillium griseofulvum]KXG51018.1 Multicopper oxidase, type 3 [Penicillium griseofulvum]